MAEINFTKSPISLTLVFVCFGALVNLSQVITSEDWPFPCGRFNLESFNLRNFDRIYGGYNAKTGQFPSFVRTWSVHRGPFGDGFHPIYCGGIIISPIHVLLPAHCATIDPQLRSWFQPSVEVRQSPKDFVVYPVSKICTKPGYTLNDPYKDDLAIYKLRVPIPFSNANQPACLPTRNISTHEQLYAIGLSAGADTSANFKLKIVNGETVIENLKLQVILMHRVPCKSQETQRMCLQPNPGYSCPGNGGGGLFAINGDRMELVGWDSHSDGWICEGQNTHTYAISARQTYGLILQLLKDCVKD